MDFAETIIARLRLTDDGSLSNKRVEQYAILRAEDVVTPWAATVVAWGGSKKVPGSAYLQNIHKSPAFKSRLEELTVEKAQLEKGGVWGRIEWQARQLYRKCAALDDVGGMQRATDTLLKVAQRNERIAAMPDEAPALPAVSRGRGAPPVEVKDPTPRDDAITQRLLERR